MWCCKSLSFYTFVLFKEAVTKALGKLCEEDKPPAKRKRTMKNLPNKSLSQLALIWPKRWVSGGCIFGSIIIKFLTEGIVINFKNNIKATKPTNDCGCSQYALNAANKLPTVQKEWRVRDKWTGINLSISYAICYCNIRIARKNNETEPQVGKFFSDTLMIQRGR